MKNRKGSIEIAIAIIGIIFILGIILIDPYFTYGNEQNIEITVKDKYIKRYNKEDIYLVVDNNGNTYKITDLLFLGKFNSTDLYNKLNIGSTYKIKTSGFRMQFFNEYPNINTLEE